MKSLQKLLDKGTKLLRDPLYRNSLMLMLTSGAQGILGFVFWLVAARLYSPADVGLVAAALAVMALLAMLSLVGLNLGLIRFLPGEKDKPGMLNSAFTVAGILALLGAAAFLAGMPLWSRGLLFLREQPLYALSFALFTLAYCLIVMQTGAFIALRSTVFILAREGLFYLFSIPLAIALAPLGLAGLYFSWGIGLLLVAIAGTLFISKALPGYRPWPALQRRVLNEMAHFSAGNYVAEVANLIPIALLPLFIVSLLGAEANAYFYMAFKVAGVLFLIPMGITMSLFAEGSYEPEKFRPNVLRAMKFTLLFLVPALPLVFLFGDKILLLFGPEYSAHSLRLLWILSLSSLPLALILLYIAVKRVQLQVKATIYTYTAMATLILGLGYLLMTRLGGVGAALGWALGQAIVAGVLMVMMIKVLWRHSRK